MKREEVEAAVERYARNRTIAIDFLESPSRHLCDIQTLADAYLAERQQRERDQQPPTREMFERLKLRGVDFDALTWSDGCIRWDIGDSWIFLDTIAKLRAACLLLGIDTEGIL